MVMLLLLFSVLCFLLYVFECLFLLSFFFFFLSLFLSLAPSPLLFAFTLFAWQLPFSICSISFGYFQTPTNKQIYLFIYLFRFHSLQSIPPPSWRASFLSFFLTFTFYIFPLLCLHFISSVHLFCFVRRFILSLPLLASPSIFLFFLFFFFFHYFTFVAVASVVHDLRFPSLNIIYIYIYIYFTFIFSVLFYCLFTVGDPELFFLLVFAFFKKKY